MKKLNLFSDLCSSVVGSRRDNGSTRLRVVYDSFTCRLRVWPLKLVSVLAILLTLGIGNAHGATATATLSTLYDGVTSNTSVNNDSKTFGTYFTVTWTKEDSPTDPTYLNNKDGNGVKLYATKNTTNGGKMTISTSSAGVYITNIAIAGKVTQGNVEFYWDGNTSTIGYSNAYTEGSKTQSANARLKETGNSKNGQYHITTITVTYVATASCTTSPTVTAASNSSVTATTATVSCSSGISSLGSAGCSISSYGFVIGTSSNPTIGGAGVTQHEVGTSYTETGTSFSKDLTGLTPSTTYYVRPYATNGNGTGYGTQTSFATSVAVYNTFSLATSSTVLSDGDEIIITNSTPNRALSTTQNEYFRGETAVTVNGSGKILVEDGGPVQVITLEKTGDNWMFNVGDDAYLRAASNSANHLKTATKEVAETNNNGVWSFSINASNIATVKTIGDYTRRLMRHNSGSSRFSCYADDNPPSEGDIKIYFCSDPRIHVSPVPLESFTYAEGDGPSQTQALTIKGFNLTGNLTVTCPTGYEIGTTSMYSGFGTSSITLTKDANGKVNTIVFIRLSSGKSAGSYNQTMSISGGGITTESINLNGNVSAVPGGTPTLYTLVQKESDIFPDDEIIVMTAKGDNILGNSPTDKSYRATVSTGFTLLGRTVYVTSSDIQNILLEGTDDEWKFNVDVPNSKYLYSGTSSNELKTNTWTYAATNGKWNISIGDATSIATVKSNLTETSSSNRNWLLYNYNSGNTPAARFNCYGSVQSDFIKLYAKPSATPNVCGSPLELTGFEMTYGEGASAAQSFKVKGRSLTSNITVTAPTGYEVCETESGTYTASLTLTPSDGKVTPTTLWVRMKADNEAADDVSGNITIAATGATTRNIAVTGTVNPNPVITLAATDAVPLVTSRNGVNIMATKTLTLNIRGARDGQTVSVSGTDLKFYRSDGTHYVDLSSTALTAPVTDQVVYVSYNPTSAGTGAITTPDITVTCDGGSGTFNNLVKARNLPDAVAIVANVNGVWQALPANMSEAQNPEAVTVTVKTEGGIQKAYGPSTLSYKLWPVKTTNGAQDRFGTYTSPAALFADRVRFAGNSNAALWANNNTTTNTIRNWATIEAVTANPAEAYEWIITTTESDGQFVYNLQTAHGDNNYYLRYWSAASGEPKWGTYANGVNSLYILPLTEVAEANISVMEWGTNKLAVSYPNGASCTAMTASINNALPTAVTMNSLGGDMYELTGVGDLQSNPAKTLVLTATEGGTKQAVMPIPYIISSEVAEATIRTAVGEAARLTDVIIRNGGKLTTGTGEGHFKDLYIYPGGKAKITNNLVVRNIYMRGGYSFLNYSDKTYAYPDLCVNSGTITTAGVKYDLYVDNRYYYMFSMPYDVALEDVTDETGSEDFPVWVKHYNGETRASGTHVTGWEWYGDNAETQHSFFAGIGYEITAKPRVSGRPVAIIRFPVKSGNITTDAEREIGVSVGNYGYDAYSSGSLAANNVGWNFVGNPYLTEYNAGTASPGNVNDTLMLVDQGYEKHIDETTGIWDGTYDWEASNKRFITVPYDTQTDYHSEFVATYTIPAFSAFFIQTTTSGTFYMRGSRPQAAGVAPRFGQAPKEKPELHINVLLSGEGESVEGKAGLLIHDKYEGGLKDFEDVEQWFVEQNELKTYTFANGVALAYNLTNEMTVEQPVPMGYIATIAGEHIYSINETNDVRELEHLWLTDNETGITTDLLARDYTFTTEAGRFDERFTLSAIFKQQEVVTDIVDVGDDDWIQSIGVYNEANTLTLRGLPENSAVYIFDMTGKLVAGGDRLHNVATFNIAAQGVYNIRVVDGERAVTLRGVIR